MPHILSLPIKSTVIPQKYPEHPLQLHFTNIKVNLYFRYITEIYDWSKTSWEAMLLWFTKIKCRKKKRKAVTSLTEQLLSRSFGSTGLLCARGQRWEVSPGHGWSAQAVTPPPPPPPDLSRWLLTLTHTQRIWFLCGICSHTGVKVFVWHTTLTLRCSILNPTEVIIELNIDSKMYDKHLVFICTIKYTNEQTKQNLGSLPSADHHLFHFQ